MQTDGLLTGCGNVVEGDSDDSDDDDGSDGEECVYSSRTRRPSQANECQGRILLKGDSFGRSYVQ